MNIGEIWKHINRLEELSKLKEGLINLYYKRIGSISSEEMEYIKKHNNIKSNGKYPEIEKRIAEINEEMNKIKLIEVYDKEFH